MTYENLVKAAKKAVKPVDTSIVKEHLAVEIDIEGKAEGAFYVEFTAKSVEVEPYEYYNHDLRIRTDADTAVAILAGETSPVVALADGKIAVEGNQDKVALLEEYLKAEEKPKKATKTAAKATEKKPVPKKVEKKPAAEKKTTAKAEAKPATTKATATKAAAKPAATKATATKVAAKPVAKKAVAKKPAAK